MSTLVITFVGGVGVLGLYALSVSAATSVKVTGLATSTAFAASSAIDLDRTAENIAGAPYIDPVGARTLALQTFTSGRDANNLAESAELTSVNIYNVKVSQGEASGADPSCDTGNAALATNAYNVYDPAVTSPPDILCWLSVAFRTSPSRTIPATNTGARTRGCPASGPSYAGGYPGYYLTCAMHFTSGVAVTVRYRVQPCNGRAIPFCSDTYAYGSGYADYTYKSN